VKIMFISRGRTPWLSMFVWGVMSLSALGTGWCGGNPLGGPSRRRPAAPNRRGPFTFLALVTGSLWGTADVGHLLGMGMRG